MRRSLLPVLFVLFIASCRPQVFTPKPSGYFRIDTPAAHEYRLFDDPAYPYSFEYPTYARIERDTVYNSTKTADNRYWINITFPSLGGVINLTYKDITPQQPLDSLLQKAWDFSFIHHEKADYIDPAYFGNAYNVSGVMYTVGGNTASRYQFAASDSVWHFIHGALYFDLTPNADSLKPATDFLERDIERMLTTLRFR